MFQFCLRAGPQCQTLKTSGIERITHSGVILSVRPRCEVKYSKAPIEIALCKDDTLLHVSATFYESFFRQPHNWQAFLPSPGSAELPLAKPRPHIVNNCPSQCHVLKTGVITLPSQEAANRKAIECKQRPAKY